ncbi:MAG: hypothetical protein GXO55_10300 [Chloroflexi bacterium]|nr:hypothetical protein [Chloroflexota bacterium]
MLSDNHRDEEEWGLPFATELDEEIEAQLDNLVGKTVVSLSLWTEPIITALSEELPPEMLEDLGDVVDIDFYFEDHHLLELYSARIYPDENAPPLEGLQRIAETLTRHVERGLRLAEIAEEAETGVPIFIFTPLHDDQELLVVADGWIVDTWDTLPEEEELD